MSVDGRIVGLCRDGAEAGELGAVEAHPVVVALMLVGEGLQYLRSVVLTVLGGLRSEEGEFVLSVTYAGHRVVCDDGLVGASEEDTLSRRLAGDHALAWGLVALEGIQRIVAFVSALIFSSVSGVPSQ